MTFKLEPAEQECHNFLTWLGLTVRSVPRTHLKSPEFEVDGDGPGYLVEVKARRDDDEIARLEPEEVYHSAPHENWSMGVRKNVSAAVRQLNQADPDHRRLWILWLADESVVGRDVTTSQIRGTLLGIRDVIDFVPNAPARPCFYAHFGAFEEFPQVDLAIIVHRGGYEPWINEFGRPDLVRASKIAQFFGPDLNVASDDGDGRYVLRGGNKRRTEAEVQDALRTTYGMRRPLMLDMKHYTGVAFVERG